MAKNYQDIYNSVYVTGNKMDWTNAMIRGNGIPLDIYSVFDSYEDAVIFAATNAVAYEGQVLAVTENGDTTVYVITPALQGKITIDETETDIYLKEVGKATLGDNKSIVLSEDGILSLKNFGVEYYAYTEIEGEDGESSYEYVKTTGWKDGLTPKVVKVTDGEGNESFEIAWYEPSTTTVEGLNDLIDTLTVKVDSEIERSTQVDLDLTERIEALEEKEDKDTTYSVKDGEKILSLDGTAFGTNLKIDYIDGKIKLLGINDVLVSEFDASAFVSDGVLENAEYDANEKTITFTWNIIIGNDEDGNPIYKTDVVEIGDLVDTYTAGNGLINKDNEFSVKVSDNEKYLIVDETGVHTKDIDTAIATAKQEAINEATAEDITYEISGNGVTVTLTPSTGESTSITLDAYTKSEADTAIDNKIASVTGGESAADVKISLETYRDAINKEIWGDDAGSWTTTTTEDGKTKVVYTPNYGATSRIDTLTSETLVDVVKLNDDVKIGLSKEGRTIKIDDSALITLINTAQTKANDAASAASAAQTTANNAQAQAGTNASEIETLKATVNTSHSEAISKNAADIAALTTKVAIEEGKVGTLETAVSNKAESSTVEALAGRVGTVEGVVSGHTTDIASLTSLVGTKANAVDVYTKSQIGELSKDNEGNDKTIVQMINDAKTSAIASATYDDTQIKSDIKNNTDAISTLIGTKEGDNTKTIREIAADEINTLIGGANNEDTITNITTLIEYVNENGAEVTGIQTDIANLQAITSGFGGEGQPSNVINFVEQEIAAIATANLTINEDETTVITKGLIVPELNKFEVAEGKVTKVSTDLLSQGEKTLVLNGGSSTI